MRLILEVAESESKRVQWLRIRGLGACYVPMYNYEKVLKYWNGVFSSENAPPVSRKTWEIIFWTKPLIGCARGQGPYWTLAAALAYINAA